MYKSGVVQVKSYGHCYNIIIITTLITTIIINKDGIDKIN